MEAKERKLDHSLSLDPKIQTYIDPVQLLSLLIRLGICKINQSNGKYELAHVQDKVITTISEHQIKDLILKSCGPKTRMALVRGHMVFRHRFLDLVESRDLPLLRDTQSSAFFVFQNAFVEVTKDGYQLKDLSELPGYVRDSQILTYECKPSGDKSKFEKFLVNVSKGTDDDHSKKRFKAFKSVIGYLLHRYKDPRVNQAVILMDSDTTAANGGTGKGIIGKAISIMRNVLPKDGKRYRKNDIFFYQNLTLFTNVIFLDDLPEDFDFGELFSALTSGIELRRKQRDAIHIPYEDSPKFLLATNTVVKGPIGNSSERRKYELELSDHYGLGHTPEDDFGLLFHWGEDEWNRFFAFMFECVRTYLQDGLVTVKPINLLESKIVEFTSIEFAEFASIFEIDQEYRKEGIFAEFQSIYSLHYLSRHMFTKYLRYYASLNGWKYVERKSNGSYIFRFAVQ